MHLPLIDDLQWLALTVHMEAEGEGYDGKVGVAFVMCNRAALTRSISDIVLERLQFSAWNADSPTRMRLDTIDPNGAGWYDSYRAACCAYFKFSHDPTGYATHYLNEELTKRISGGRLPSWFDPAKVTARIGKHTFLKLH